MRIEELLLNEKFAAKSFYIIDDQGEWHYHELYIRVLALAEKLKYRGVQPLDRIALISENGATFLIGLLGILAAGAIAVPIDPQIPTTEVLKRVSQCSITGICIAGIRPEKNFTINDETPGYCFILSEKNGDWNYNFTGGQAAQFTPVGTDQDTAVILFSSGTTGTPKGVMLTHGAIMANISAIIEYMKPEPADRFYIIKTMVHIATLTGELLTGLRVGAGIIACHPVVPPTIILKRIEIMKPTIFFVNPTILSIVLKVRNVSFDLSSIRLVYTSGAVAEKDLLAEAGKFFPKASVLNVYGLTEAGPRVTAQHSGERIKLGSVGKPIQGVSIIIKGSEGKICKNGETGIVFVNSPSMMLGYWSDGESTNRKIIDGWLDTGDFGYMDEDGELFILGRADDVIVRGSHKIDPYRVENVIRKIQGVNNCVVFGIPDDIDGHRVVCLIQKEEGALVEEQKIMSDCRDYLAPYELPQIICEWDEIPLTATGKISRKLARDLYLHRVSIKKNLMDGNPLLRIGSIKVSVIMPVFNQSQSLKVALKHFALQTYPAEHFEIIVVDDGSTDGLMQQVRETDWPVTPSAIQYLRQENQGRAVARNTGAAVAKGELLIFCDADRVPEPDFISRHAGCNPKGEKLAVIGCPWDYFGKVEMMEKTSDTLWQDIRRFSRKPGYYSKIMKLFNQEGNSGSAIAWAAFLVGNSSIYRDDFEKVGGFDPDFKTWGFEHFELAIRLQKAGVSFYSSPQAENYHIPHLRGSNFYQTMLKSSLELLQSKYPDDKYGLLGDFLLGGISLQEFEIGFGGILSPGLMNEKPIFNLIK